MAGKLWKKIRAHLWPSMGPKRLAIYLYWMVVRSFGSPHRVALGGALAIFVGWMPIPGLHNFVVFFLALALRLNVVVALFVVNTIAFPWLIPFVMSLTYTIGTHVLRMQETFDFTRVLHFDYLIHHLGTLFLPMFVGALGPATLSALVVGGAAYGLVAFHKKRRRRKIWRRKQKKQAD